MENTSLAAHKEQDPEKLATIVETHCYPKPSWMLNESIFDTIWRVSITGFEVDYSKNLNHGRDVSFAFQVSHNELLTDKTNQPLLEDLRNSLLYLNVKGKITRPERIADVLICACYLILHENELRRLKGQNPIRSLAEISFEHTKDYLMSFKVEKHVFDKSLDIILRRWGSKSEIDWDLLKQSNTLTTRQLHSLKHKLTKHLDNNHQGFQPSTSGYSRQYANACGITFDIDYDLAPKNKTISNEISKLHALYTARPSQKYKFRHSVQDLFSSGATIFDEMVESRKTPLMPVKTALHTISSALHFARTYGPSLRTYLSLLSKAEKALIDSHGAKKSASHLREFQRAAFESTSMPAPLKDLRITNWSYDYDLVVFNNNFSNGIPVSVAVRLYTASIYILLASFSAARTKSLLTLRRSCFKQSPIDDLFDLALRIPKSSERWELEEVQRPIPDTVWDYGLEFAAFVSELEDRRGLVANDNESFLFSQTLTTRSISASTYKNEKSVHNKALSDDTLNDSLDIFMDWIESPLTNNERWYARTHQFRRFFAVLYFNFTDQEGLDELSWFVGHSNLDQTFHYAEVAPTDEWTEEAELTISKIGASLTKHINADDSIRSIVDKARKTSNVSTVIEPLVQKLIAEHKEKTKQEVRFSKIDGEDVFFYFTGNKGY